MRKRSTHKRIGIVYPGTYLDSIPSLYNAVILLARHGYIVDIFTYTSSACKPPSFRGSVNTIILKRVQVVQEMEKRRKLPRRRRIRSLGPVFLPARRIYREAKTIAFIFSIVSLAFTYALWVRKAHSSSPYRCFIGVDPQGIFLSAALTCFLQIPLIYYSLELFLSEELNQPWEKWLKKQEVTLSHKSQLIISQDKQRAQLLAKDNRLPLGKFFFVPNTPLGTARRSPSRYWHRHFSLPKSYKVVLHTGNLNERTCIKEIVSSTNKWPKNWVLVVHTRYYVEAGSWVLRRIQKLAHPGRVLFSLEPVPSQKYDELVDGADIGIAFYKTVPGSIFTQQNIKVLGLSSGKYAYYLRAGLPVVVNKSSSLGKLTEKERCGISVSSAHEIGRAIARIAQNYEEYSWRACQAFKRYFNFERGFEKVIKQIEST